MITFAFKYSIQQSYSTGICMTTSTHHPTHYSSDISSKLHWQVLCINPHYDFEKINIKIPKLFGFVNLGLDFYLVLARTMKTSRILACFVLHLNLQNNIYCKDSKYYSTFGDSAVHFGESGSGITDYVTLKNDLKSRFSEGRFRNIL